MKRLMLTVTLVALAASRLLAGGGGTVKGSYVEARTAEVFAGGCVMNSEAGTAGRQAILAWKIDRGTFNGVTLDGLSVVAAVAGDQNLGIQEIGGSRATTKAAVYVDQRASVPQQMALIAMANQLSGGMMNTVVQITPTPIAFSEDHDTVRLAAGHVALDVNKHLEHDPQCGGMQWFHPLSTGTQATLGQTQRHMFTGASLGTKWSDPFKRSAFFGTFAY